MLEYAQYKALTGYAVEEKTEAQLIEAIGKKITQETSAAIATALLSFYLIEVRNYKVTEAAQALEVTEGYLSLAAARGHVLHLAATETTAHTVWAQIRALTAKETREMGAALVAKGSSQAPTHLRDVVTRSEVAKRLGDNATPEKRDAIAAQITEAGAVTPKAIRKAIPAVAESLGIELPKQERSGSTDGANDRKAATVPTPAMALSMLEKFEQDRTQGSDDETPFTVSESEAGDLVAVALVAARILRQAGQVAQIVEVAALVEETLGLVTESA